MTPDNFGHPRWILKLFGLIRNHWHHQGQCYSIHFDAWRNAEKRFWQLTASPVHQQLFGGSRDGASVWTGYVFDSGAFSREYGVWLQELCLMSKCGQETPRPKMVLKGSYEKHNFFIDIFLEPEDGVDVSEVLDTITNQVRPARIEEEEDK